MHKDIVYLHPEFQTAITVAILVQLLRNKGFITPKKTTYLNMYYVNCTSTTVTHPL